MDEQGVNLIYLILIFLNLFIKNQEFFILLRAILHLASHNRFKRCCYFWVDVNYLQWLHHVWMQLLNRIRGYFVCLIVELSLMVKGTVLSGIFVILLGHAAGFNGISCKV